MRSLVYYVAFDCFLFEGPHFPDLFDRFPETFPAHLRPVLGITKPAQRFDTVLMGRRTYEVGLKEGVTSPYAPLRQYVVSRTMLAPPDPAVTLHNGDPVELVRRLKSEEGREIWLCGGGALAAALLGEIDELILKINPIVIGRGIPLFEGVETLRRADPLEHTPYPNGFVLARYRLR